MREALCKFHEKNKLDSPRSLAFGLGLARRTQNNFSFATKTKKQYRQFTTTINSGM